MTSAVFRTALPLVVDADALNLLAASPFPRADWVLTPHPGEAARLLRGDASRIQSDRFAATSALARETNGVVVLKGACTQVGSPARALRVCTAGNPGMASGGMGDVLTGVIAALGLYWVAEHTVL
jgi:NAD(P)H-hydrate epimerase